MTHETPHPNTVIARLEKLERQHHRLKLAGACLLLLGSSLLCMGAFSSPSRTVKAEHFALLDPRGKVRARLSTIGDHTMLSFNDQVTRASRVGADGFPGLVFHDQHGQVRVCFDLREADTWTCTCITPDVAQRAGGCGIEPCGSPSACCNP